MSQPHHEDEEDDHDPEGPDPSEMDDSNEPDLEVCPHCRKLITEEAEQCPHCGEYVSAEDAPMSIGAWIVIAIVILVLVALFLRM